MNIGSDVYMKNNKLSKEDIKSIIRVIIIGLLGVALSVLFIWLYIKCHNTYITILTGVISLTYMIVSVIIISKKDLIFENTAKSAILFPIIYTIIIFAFLIFIKHKFILDNPIIILDCFMYAVYMMPSFLVVMTILLLVAVAMCYAG